MITIVKTYTPQTPVRTSQTVKDNLSETSADSCDHLDQYEPTWCSEVGNMKVKSSLCRNFMETGFCAYGNRCQFAHGPTQLRCNVEDQMLYKTRTCHAYAKKGYCQYGARCNFVHTKEKSGRVSKPSTFLREPLYFARTHTGSRMLWILASQ